MPSRAVQLVPQPHGDMVAMTTPPQLPVTAVKTYALHAPVESHRRKATCAEADCPAYQHGWRSTVDESGSLGQGQATYIRRDSGRRFTEERTEAGLTVFTFEAGQRCFSSDSHTVSLEREPIYVVRDGDWRGNPTGARRVHVDADEWIEDFGEHQETLADRHNQG